MKVNLIGLRALDFENDKGDQVQGIKLFIAYPDDNVYGNCTESRFIMADRFDKLGLNLKDLIDKIDELISRSTRKIRSSGSSYDRRGDHSCY